MTTVAVVYHSGYGHTARQAEHVCKGAESVDSVDVTLHPVEAFSGESQEQAWSQLDGADAIIFGAPTYMGSVSGPMKSFIDSTSQPWAEQRWADKLAAGFTNSGSHSGDKLSTLISFALLAAQQGMVWINLNLMPGFNSSSGSIDDLNRVGGFLGAMAQSNVDEDAGTMIASDLKTAEHLGRRVAEVALRWTR